MPHVTSVTVDGLLGRFNHSIDFPLEDTFVILHGPNGVGKTKLLELLSAALSSKFGRLKRIPFRIAKIEFDNKSRLEITQVGEPTLDIGDSDPDSAEATDLEIRLYPQPQAKAITAHIGEFRSELPRRSLLRYLEMELPLERIEPDLWSDLAYGDVISTDEVLDRYEDNLPGRYAGRPRSEGTQEVEAFLESIPVHLIETQRLLTLARSAPTYRHHRVQPRATVSEFARDLTERLAEALAQNSQTSQQLDRGFPSRVLEEEAPSGATDEAIRRWYEEQNQMRQQLAEIAILDPAPDVRLPERELSDWERRFLWMYLQDTEEKLNTFSALLSRVQLLLNIVNDRFLFKTVQIDREAGFRVRGDDSHEIELESLSSGEQHELVLAYDLLFNVREGSLVLIDEPEISLHVGWQQEFLNDISRIGAVTDLRFIVATHSPQIIHKWWDKAVALETVGASGA